MKQHEKIKNKISNIKNVIKNSRIIVFLFVFFIILFLAFNLISSQLISPLYFDLVNDDEVSTVGFLKKIKNLTDYKKTLEMNNNIFGGSVREEIFHQENLKKDMINNLEQQLTINLKSRDVLYSLYKLYLSKDDTVRANDYLRMAKEIDPSIK